MRIIGGMFRGKKLTAASETITRPTLDRAKESLFNILESYLLKKDKQWADILFVDVFAGSGAIGIEALSRGAKKAIFFENHPVARYFLARNLNGLKNVSFQVGSEALRPPHTTQAADILFMDPPYHHGLIEKTLPIFYRTGWIGQNTYIITEADSNESIRFPHFLSVSRVVYYGRNQFVFAQMNKEEMDEHLA